jgi:hypothetical protein
MKAIQRMAPQPISAFQAVNNPTTTVGGTKQSGYYKKNIYIQI